jgi:hypothetical protein
MIDPGESRSEELVLQEYVERFRLLLREMAETLSVDPISFLETNTLAIGGINVAFIHYGPFDPGHLTCCLEMREMKEEALVDAYRVMLEQNVSLPGSCGSFGLIPDSGRPALLLRLGLDANLTSAKLLAVVEQLILRYVQSFSERQQDGPAGQHTAPALQEALRRQQERLRHVP